MESRVEESKNALRQRVLESRRALAPADLVQAAERLRDVLLDVPEVAGAARLAAYVSVGREPGTGPLLEALRARGTEVLLPVQARGDELDWARYEGPELLAPASRGMVEPVGETLSPDPDPLATVDAVLVPGLAVDRRGLRLGRGAGSFDRALAEVPAGTFTCVLLHDGEVLDLPVPHEPHDMPVQAAATPTGLRRLR